MLDTVMSLRDYFRRVGRVCDSADPATDLVRVLLRPSRCAGIYKLLSDLNVFGNRYLPLCDKARGKTPVFIFAEASVII